MDTKTLTIKFSGLFGPERTMHIRYLGHREFWSVMTRVMKAATGVLQIGNGKMSLNLSGIFGALDEEDFRMVATGLLSHGVLEGVGTIESPLESDYFRDNPDELIYAMVAAVKALNPELFRKIQAALPKKTAGDSASQNVAENQKTATESSQ